MSDDATPQGTISLCREDDLMRLRNIYYGGLLIANHVAMPGPTIAFAMSQLLGGLSEMPVTVAERENVFLHVMEHIRARFVVVQQQMELQEKIAAATAESAAAPKH